MANICLHKSTDAKLYPFTEGDKDLLEKVREDVVGGPSMVFTRKAVVDPTFIRTSTNICMLLLELMPANYTPTRCANPCPPVFIRVGISIQKTVDSHLDKTRPVALKKWSCLIFNVQDLIAKLRASTLQADRRKLIALVLMGFVLIAILCLKQWVAFTTFVPVKSCAHLSTKKMSNVAVGKKNSMNWGEAIYRRKFSLSLKCGNVSGGDFTRQPLTSYPREFLYRRSLTEQQLLE